MASRRKLQPTANVGGHGSIGPAPMRAQRPVNAETEVLDDSAISALVNFFKTLDKWDLEANCNGKVM